MAIYIFICFDANRILLFSMKDHSCYVAIHIITIFPIDKTNSSEILCSFVNLFNDIGSFMLNIIKLNENMGFCCQSVR